MIIPMKKEVMVDLNQMKMKKQRKHYEVALVFVERTRSIIFDGKYIYSVTTEERYPIFEHVYNKYLLIQQYEDVYYYDDSDLSHPVQVELKKKIHQTQSILIMK